MPTPDQTIIIRDADGTEVEHELVDLATPSMIARALNVNRSTVGMWIARRESNGFPEPLIGVGRTSLYSAREVDSWLAEQP